MAESLIQPPFPAYAGDGPFIFASYCHKDSARVYPDLLRLRDAKLPIWYDEGIPTGTEWPVEVQRAVENCAVILVFITKKAVDSSNVRNEVNLAINKKKSCVPVYLENTKLEKGLDLQIGSIQAILKYRITEKIYFDTLITRLQSLLKTSSNQVSWERGSINKTPVTKEPDVDNEATELENMKLAASKLATHLQMERRRTRDNTIEMAREKHWDSCAIPDDIASFFTP